MKTNTSYLNYLALIGAFFLCFMVMFGKVSNGTETVTIFEKVLVERAYASSDSLGGIDFSNTDGITSSKSAINIFDIIQGVFVLVFFIVFVYLYRNEQIIFHLLCVILGVVVAFTLGMNLPNSAGFIDYAAIIGSVMGSTPSTIKVYDHFTYIDKEDKS